ILNCEGHTGRVNCVACSPDGKRLASASSDQTVKLWDSQTGNELLSLKGHTNEVRGLAFSPDGDRLVSAGREIKMWDARSGKELFSLAERASQIAFSPDGRRFVCAGDKKAVRVRDAQTGKEIVSFMGHTEGVRSAVYSPDGTKLVSGSADETA